MLLHDAPKVACKHDMIADLANDPFIDHHEPVLVASRRGAQVSR
jgi:hypothetical protein